MKKIFNASCYILAFMIFHLLTSCHTDGIKSTKYSPPDIKSEMVQSFIPSDYRTDSIDDNQIFPFLDEDGNTINLTQTGIILGVNDEKQQITKYEFHLYDHKKEANTFWYEIYFNLENTKYGTVDAMVYATIDPTRNKATNTTLKGGSVNLKGGAVLFMQNDKILMGDSTVYYPERKICGRVLKDIYCGKGEVSFDDDIPSISFETCIKMKEGLVAYAIGDEFYVLNE